MSTVGTNFQLRNCLCPTSKLTFSCRQLTFLDHPEKSLKIFFGHWWPFWTFHGHWITILGRQLSFLDHPEKKLKKIFFWTLGSIMHLPWTLDHHPWSSIIIFKSYRKKVEKNFFGHWGRSCTFLAHWVTILGRQLSFLDHTGKKLKKIFFGHWGRSCTFLGHWVTILGRHWSFCHHPQKIQAKKIFHCEKEKK
jgi:hypothetical protein